MPEPKLTYGIDSETRKLVHISDAVDMRVYLCPKCEDELTLYNHWPLGRVRMRGQRKHYFYSHKKGSNCAGAQMTVLHSLAQKILFEEKKIMLPEYKGEHGYNENSVSKEFAKVVLENTIVEDGLFRRPDCIARKTNEADPKHDLWIEIFVTHPLDDIKISEIRESGTYCIEIDMREFLNKDFTQDSIRDFLLNSPRNRKWICCPVWDQKDEEKGRKDEENEKTLNEKPIVEARLLVDKWFKTGDIEAGKAITEHLDSPRYTSLRADRNIVDYRTLLIGDNNNVFDYILRSPKNKVGMKLFDYILCQFSYDVPKIESSVKNALNRIEFKRQNNQGYTPDDFELQELFTLVGFYYLKNNRDKDFHANGDCYKIANHRLTNSLYLRRRAILSDIIQQHKSFEFSDLDSLLIKYFPDDFKNMSEIDRKEAAVQRQRDEDDRLFRQQQEEATDLHTESGFNRRVPNWTIQELDEHISEQQAIVDKCGDIREKELLQKMKDNKEKRNS